MKNTLPFCTALALTGALCLSTFALPEVRAQEQEKVETPAPQADGLASRVEALESELKQLRMANKSQEALLKQAILYLENQATSAAALSAAMTRTESLGFTKGINYQSREVMLSALQAHCKALQKNVPRLPKPAPKQAPRRR